jgi:hypothetical protein
MLQVGADCADGITQHIARRLWWRAGQWPPRSGDTRVRRGRANEATTRPADGA